jgi:hypothetical protein
MKNVIDSIFYSVMMTGLMFALGLHILLLMLWSCINQIVAGLAFLCATVLIAFLGLASLINAQWADEKLDQVQEWADNRDE